MKLNSRVKNNILDVLIVLGLIVCVILICLIYNKGNKNRINNAINNSLNNEVNNSLNNVSNNAVNNTSNANPLLNENVAVINNGVELKDVNHFYTDYNSPKFESFENNVTKEKNPF